MSWGWIGLGLCLNRVSSESLIWWVTLSVLPKSRSCYAKTSGILLKLKLVCGFRVWWRDLDWIRNTLLFWDDGLSCTYLCNSRSNRDDDIMIRFICYDDRQRAWLKSGKVNKTWFDYQAARQREGAWMLDNDRFFWLQKASGRNSFQNNGSSCWNSLWTFSMHSDNAMLTVTWLFMSEFKDRGADD